MNVIQNTTFNLYRLFTLIIFELIFFFVSKYLLKKTGTEFYFFFLIFNVFLIIYNGIGAAYQNVPSIYLLQYILFKLSLLYSTLFFLLLFKKISISFTNVIEIKTVSNGYFYIFIFIFLFLKLLDLTIPDNKLLNLFHPPKPDLKAFLIETIEKKQTSSIEIILKYLSLLITPLYYLSLQVFNKKKFLFFSFFPLYVAYCKNSYIGRGAILVNLGFIFLYFITKSKNKKKLIIISLVLAIPLLVFFVLYSYWRNSSDVGNINITDLLFEIFYQETNFPSFYETVTSKNTSTYIIDFFRWFLTLPLPKSVFNIQNIKVFNFEISEIILGLGREDYGFFVVLTGIITESNYIFGKYFFWIEALVIGFLISTIHSIFGSIKIFKTFYLYLIVYISFMLSRAGITAVAPYLFNQLLLVYLLIIIISQIKAKKINVL